MNRFETPEVIRQYIADSEQAIANKPAPHAVSIEYVADVLAEQVNAKVQDVVPNDRALDVDTPPKGIDGDIAVAMFPLAPALRMAPPVIAAKVAEGIGQLESARSDYIETATAVGPYVNMGLDRTNVVRDVVANVLDEQRYGASNALQGRTHLLDYSAPNIAKKLGFQHIPTTVIGESLARIYTANGAKAIRINHLGDFGTPFGKVMLGVEKYGFDFESDDPVDDMHKLYVRVHNESKEDESVAAAARDRFMRLENGDQKLLQLWQQLRALNVNENDSLYDQLGVSFDATIGESNFVAGAHAIVDRLVEQGIAVQDTSGAVYVPGEKVMDYLGDGRQIGNVVLRKSDGATLYATRDLATIEYRAKQFNPDSIEYVVGGEQSEHFIAVFAIASMARLVRPDTELIHTEIGMLAGPSGKKLSSRDGNTRSMAETFAAAREQAKGSPLLRGYADSPEEQGRLADMLGDALVTFPILKKAPSTNTIVHDMSQLSREAESVAPILQAYGRADHFAKSADFDEIRRIAEQGPEGPVSDSAWRLTKAVMSYPAAVKKAAEEHSPSHIASAASDVALAYQGFHENAEVATGDSAVRAALALAAKTAIGNSLDLLNIGVTEKK